LVLALIFVVRSRVNDRAGRWMRGSQCGCRANARLAISSAGDIPVATLPRTLLGGWDSLCRLNLRLQSAT
jgi:hypothetical protein